MSAKDLERVQAARTGELGEITRDTLVPISRKPDDINVIVAGGRRHALGLPADLGPLDFHDPVDRA